jgi:hypothetical protein
MESFCIRDRVHIIMIREVQTPEHYHHLPAKSTARKSKSTCVILIWIAANFRVEIFLIYRKFLNQL